MIWMLMVGNTHKQSKRFKFLTCETAAVDNDGSWKVVADKSVPWPLNHDEDGYPTLPDMVGKSLPDLKDIVRSFVTLSYRMPFSIISLLDSDQHLF
jgi:hypothetical protein